MKKSHPFFLFLINSNIFVSFCVLSLALSSEFLLITSEISFPSKVSQFVFFATIFTYNFQRIVRLRKSEKHSRKDWIKKNKSTHRDISIAHVFVLFGSRDQVLSTI